MARQWSARSGAAATAVLLALSLGGCSRGSLEDLNPAVWFSTPGPKAAAGSEGGFTVTRGPAQAITLAAVTPSDLVGSDGACQGGASEPGTAPRVGLTMTECELVAVAGAPEQVNVGADEGGDRRVVLTYSKGDHPGIYTFVSGRLKIIERSPTPAKPEPRRRAPKKKTA